MYKIILLDVDGTLLDFEMSQKKALELTFQKYGYPLTEETKAVYNEINHRLWKEYERGLIDRETVVYTRFGELFRRVGIAGDGVAFEDDYQEMLGNGAYLLPGALELVQYLYRKYDLYIITNGVTKTQRKRLRDSGLDRYMKDIFISGELGVQKPRKEYFDACLSRMEKVTSKTDMLIIGDTLSSDILGGIHAGIDTCWFNPKGAPADPDIPATMEVHCFEALYEIL